jgi:hypothetical protein
VLDTVLVASHQGAGDPALGRALPDGADPREVAVPTYTEGLVRPGEAQKSALCETVDCLTRAHTLRVATILTRQKTPLTRAFCRSGRRDSNPRPSPWQGDDFRPCRPFSPVEQALLR